MGFWTDLLASYAASYVGGAGGMGGGGSSGGGKGGAGASGYDKYAPYVKAGVSLAGAYAKGKQSGRETKNAADRSAADFRQSDAQFAERALENRVNLDLERRKYADSAQDRDYANALRAAIAGRIPAIGGAKRPNGVPNISFIGGGSWDILGPEGRAAASELYSRAYGDLMSGKPGFDALPPIERTNAPVYQGPGKLENTLGVIGSVGSAYSQAKSQKQNQSIIDEILAAQQKSRSNQAGGGTDRATLEALLEALRRKQDPTRNDPNDEDM